MNNQFTPRMKQILSIMLRYDKVLSVKTLADEIGVSKRTIQREIEYLGHSLDMYEIDFCSRAGTGIWLEGSKEGKSRLLHDLESDIMADSFDKSERRKRLILEILKDSDLKKLQYYSSLFGVSEATISSDLEHIGEWFEKYHLKIVRKPGYGLKMEGTEKNLRRAIRGFIDENIDTKMMKQVYEGNEQSEEQIVSAKKINNIYRILDNDLLKDVVSTLSGLQDDKIYHLTENAYTGLVIHITIAVKRILEGEIIEEKAGIEEVSEKDSNYILACKISRALEEKFDIFIPDVETVYIYLHLKGAKKQYADSDGGQIIMNPDRWRRLINDLIDAYDEDFAYYLKQDDEFLQSLIAHLQPTVIRLKNEMHLKNPLLGQIKEEYREIFHKCEKVAVVLGEQLNCKIPEEEIGFLALHFGAAVVRLENAARPKRKVKIGIVCASGIGISRLMLSKVKHHFGHRVEIEAYGKNDVTPYIMAKQDFLISSIDLPGEEQEGDIIYVNPLLPDKDMRILDDKVSHYEKLPEKNSVEDIFTRQLDQVHYMAVQIKTVLKELKVMKVDDYISFDEFLVAVSEKLSPYSDRQYMIQEDIRKRERLGSQVFSSMGFSLFHARTLGVVKPAFMVCLTKNRGVFYDSYFQGIDVCLVMLVPDDEHAEENGKILGCLSSMLIEEDEFLYTLKNGEIEEIRNLMSGYLKKFFDDYLIRM